MVNIMTLHFIYMALMIATGLFCLTWSYILWSKHDNKIHSANNKYSLFFSGFLWIGFFLIFWPIHSELSHHKNLLIQILQSGENNTSTLMLGLLGVVMTLVTAGVIAISRQAIDDIRREKLNLYDNYEELKRVEAFQKIELIRLELLYQNQQELDKFNLMEKNLSKQDEDKMLFRDSLQVHYAKPDGIPVYIKDIHDRYNPAKNDKLLPREIDYLREIQKYYQSLPPQNDEQLIIPKYIDDIFKR